MEIEIARVALLNSRTTNFLSCCKCLSLTMNLAA